MNKEIYKNLLIGMKKAFNRNENAMQWARAFLNDDNNRLESTLISYELQSGSYIQEYRSNNDLFNDWCHQLYETIVDSNIDFKSILEVGVGEATTLRGLLDLLNNNDLKSYGLDISWSRLSFAQEFLNMNGKESNLFVADLFNIPLPDNCIDIVYTAHSLEPNGGKEEDAIKELVRVASKRVILIEPSYEHADEDAKKRMENHGYVRGLPDICNRLGLKVMKYELLGVQKSPLNPAAVLVIDVENSEKINEAIYLCPIGMTSTQGIDGGLFSKESGHFYPIIQDIPILIPEKGIMTFFIDRKSI